jgi:hypothetical protein
VLHNLIIEARFLAYKKDSYEKIFINLEIAQNIIRLIYSDLEQTEELEKYLMDIENEYQKCLYQNYLMYNNDKVDIRILGNPTSNKNLKPNLEKIKNLLRLKTPIRIISKVCNVTEEEINKIIEEK